MLNALINSFSCPILHLIYTELY